MKECDIFRGVKTYSDPLHIFRGGPDPRNPPPMIYAPADTHTHALIYSWGMSYRRREMSGG